ncbi:MAG: rhomboid family intramembrane serine protease [Deltaproteobacteria bacterium]|nr:rhomboid family intramembrane serine protease [Deltaproteobacteria bacterium]
MFPLRDENPSVLTALGTFLIVGLNVAAWLLVQGLGAEPTLTRSVCEYGLIPGEILHRLPAGTRVPLGDHLACILGQGPTWLTPLSSMFLHGGWLHLIGNLWFLWVFGNNVEDAMGHARFLAFYVVCGLAAAAAQTLANPASDLPMVGASGAIGGVMGAYAVLYPKNRIDTLIIFGFYVRTLAVPAYVMLGYWFVLQVLGGLPSLGGEGAGVAFWAHVGGFVAGALLVRVFRDPELLARQRARATVFG